MPFEDFLEGLSNSQIRDLAQRVQRNEVAAPRELRLRELLEGTSMAERQRAFDRKPAVVDLLVALNLEFDFPDGLGPPPEPEVDEAEDEVEIEEAEPEPDRQPDLEPAEIPRGRRRQPEVGRPSPYGAEADKEIADRFFNGNFMKGNAWVSAEQERLSRFPDHTPGEFWGEIGDDIWGGQLDVLEFINPRGNG